MPCGERLVLRKVVVAAWTLLDQATAYLGVPSANGSTIEPLIERPRTAKVAGSFLAGSGARDPGLSRGPEPARRPQLLHRQICRDRAAIPGHRADRRRSRRHLAFGRGLRPLSRRDRRSARYRGAAGRRGFLVRRGRLHPHLFQLAARPRPGVDRRGPRALSALGAGVAQLYSPADRGRVGIRGPRRRRRAGRPVAAHISGARSADRKAPAGRNVGNCGDQRPRRRRAEPAVRGGPQTAEPARPL